jgi:hypothetical protein
VQQVVAILVDGERVEVMPAAAIKHSVRTNRCAMVASGATKGRAISAVVKGQPDLGLPGERRVAAGEDQPQPIIVLVVSWGDR